MSCMERLLQNARIGNRTEKLRNRGCYGNSDVSKWQIICVLCTLTQKKQKNFD